MILKIPGFRVNKVYGGRDQEGGRRRRRGGGGGCVHISPNEFSIQPDEALVLIYHHTLDLRDDTLSHNRFQLKYGSVSFILSENHCNRCITPSLSLCL
mmetsp:Transcript_6739/g.6967  ORF Transcript_6739/g.6967 Transcript_6739/m.6967 type:complete len:98 (-) Transcript_6739:45-338(-)